MRAVIVLNDATVLCLVMHQQNNEKTDLLTASNQDFDKIHCISIEMIHWEIYPIK